MGAGLSPNGGLQCCMPEAPVPRGRHAESCCQSCTQESPHGSKSSGFMRVEALSMLEWGPGSAPIGAVLDETMLHLGALERQLLLFSGTTCLAAVHWLLFLGAAYDTSDLNGSTCLHVACRTGAVSIIAELLKYRELLEATDIAGWTPLHVAAHVGRKEAIVRLLDAGASPEARTRQGQTPAALSMDLSTRRLLAEHPQEHEQQRLGRVMGQGDEPVEDAGGGPWAQASAHAEAGDTAGLPTEGDPEFYFVPPRRAIWDTLLCEKQLWQLAVLIFNQQPGYGLAFVVACGLADSYSEAAKLVLRSGRASRRRAGMFLGTTFSVCKIIRFSIFDGMDLAGTGVVGALCLAFALLQLPGDLRMTARLVQAVAEVWWVKHRRVSRLLIQRGEAHHHTEASEVRAERMGEYAGMDLFEYLASWDALAQLMLSTVLLHWFVHNDDRHGNRRGMPIETWLELNRGIENGGANIPEHVQRRIHKTVCRDYHAALALATPERQKRRGSCASSSSAAAVPAGAPGGRRAHSAGPHVRRVGADAAGGAVAEVVADVMEEEPSAALAAPRRRRSLSEADSAAGLGASPVGAAPQPAEALLARSAKLEGWVQVPGKVLPFSSHHSDSLPESLDTCEGSGLDGGPSPRADAASALGGYGQSQATAAPADAPGSMADGHFWVSICSVLLLFSAHPHTSPHAMTDVRRLCLSGTSGIFGRGSVLTLVGTHSGEEAEEEAGTSEVEPSAPILVLLLLPDGRWREVRVPKLELRFSSDEEAAKMVAIMQGRSSNPAVEALGVDCDDDVPTCVLESSPGRTVRRA